MLVVSDMAMPAQNDNHTTIRCRRLAAWSDVSTPTVADTSSPPTDSDHNSAPTESDPPSRAKPR